MQGAPCTQHYIPLFDYTPNFLVQLSNVFFFLGIDFSRYLSSSSRCHDAEFVDALNP